MAILSVVKVTIPPESDWQPDYNGKYIKLGGGFTDDLQKAHIFGWAKGSQQRMKYYTDSPNYTRYPVRIEMETE